MKTNEVKQWLKNMADGITDKDSVTVQMEHRKLGGSNDTFKTFIITISYSEDKQVECIKEEDIF